MQQNAGNVALLERPAPRFAAPRIAAPEGVTVCVSGAVLAPAPTAAATGLAPVETASPVFVDDSGARKRLLRVVGILVGLLAVGFLGVVGVALAVPSVATSVGLGDAMPFVVPGAAAKPPAPAPAAQAPVAKPTATPRHTVAAKPKPKPRVEARPTKPAPVAQAPVTEAPKPAADEVQTAGTDTATDTPTDTTGTKTDTKTGTATGGTDTATGGTDTPAGGTATPAGQTGPDQGAGQQARAAVDAA